MNDRVLMHHGVKGMKWGVRRTPEQLGHRIEKAKKTASEVKERNQGDINTAKTKLTNTNESAIKRALKMAMKPKAEEEDLSKYTNKELQEKVTRMNLENQYRRLADERNTSEGREIVTDLLASSGGIVLSTAATVAAAEVVRHLLKAG